jgi:spore coat polysaccharide biosynthesis protein SpsF
MKLPLIPMLIRDFCEVPAAVLPIGPRRTLAVISVSRRIGENAGPFDLERAVLEKTIGVIQARMGSERLPGKIIAPLGGRPLLAQLWARIGGARVDEWWLATSSHPTDDVTEAWGFELGLRVFRGARTNVLSRFLAIGTEAKAEWIVRVTADNPFLDAKLIDALLDARDASPESKNADAIRFSGGLPIADPSDEMHEPSATTPRLPLGYGVELIRLSALQRADKEIPEKEFYHRTHVTSWLSSNASGNAKICDTPTPSAWPSRPDWRWTVDTYEDLAMARSAFRVFGREADTIDYPAMVAHLDAHPEIAAMNRHIDPKATEEG